MPRFARRSVKNVRACGACPYQDILRRRHRHRQRQIYDARPNLIKIETRVTLGPVAVNPEARTYHAKSCLEINVMKLCECWANALRASLAPPQRERQAGARYMHISVWSAAGAPMHQISLPRHNCPGDRWQWPRVVYGEAANERAIGVARRSTHVHRVLRLVKERVAVLRKHPPEAARQAQSAGKRGKL